jgi:hypothetical protein
MDGGSPVVDWLEFASNSVGGRHLFAAAAVALLTFFFFRQGRAALLTWLRRRKTTTQPKCCAVGPWTRSADVVGVISLYLQKNTG